MPRKNLPVDDRRPIPTITSAFPAAFPPFRLEQIQKGHAGHYHGVETALENLAQTEITRITERSFADGGLLDNKPFGPVLEAIFHRMPNGIVDRRLFYVEPDPAPRPEPPDPGRHTPVAVATASLNTIPSHESLWGDLQELERHNAQVRWLKRLKDRTTERVKQGAAAATDNPAWSPYWETRTESLARSLFLASDVMTPSAEDAVSDPTYGRVLGIVCESLNAWTAPQQLPEAAGPAEARPLLNAFDIDFHLRRSFHLLYGLSEQLQNPHDPSTGYLDACRTAMRLTGRIIKTQKLIRDLMLVLRGNALNEVSALREDPGLSDPAAALMIVNLFRLFLRVDAPFWQTLRRHCVLSASEIWGIGNGDWRAFFSSDDLSAAADAARAAAREPAGLARHLLPPGRESELQSLLTQDDLSVRWTILDEIERATRAMLDVDHPDRRDLGDFVHAFEGFIQVDLVTYPLEFAGAVYELDEVEYVRISPQDAQTALSAGSAGDKVAGDELVHFSAFLRQDWRSNDILQGRFDGICQIVHSLLTPTAGTVRRLVERVRTSQADLDRLFDPSAPTKLCCRDETRRALHAAWQAVVTALAHEPVRVEPYTASAHLVGVLTSFCGELIRAGQEDAFREDFPAVLEDHFYQEMAFGSVPDATNSGTTSPTVLRCAAKASSEKCLESTAGGPETDETFGRWLDKYREMNLGRQAVSGRDGGVPPHIVGEYVTHAYLLLYGMIRASLGETGQAILDQHKVRLVLRQPLAFLNVVFSLMRQAFTLALATITTTAGVLIGLAVAAYFREGIGLNLLGAIVTLLSFMAIIAWAVPRWRRWRLAIAFLPIVFVLVIGLAAYIIASWSDWRGLIATHSGALADPNAQMMFAVGVAVGVVGCALLAWIGGRRRR